MSLTTRVWNHNHHQRVDCFICHAGWKEQYVGVAHCEGREFVGSLCPRCLTRTPLDAATWILESCVKLQKAIDDLHNALAPRRHTGLPATAAEFRERIRETAETTERIKRMAGLLRIRKRDLPQMLSRLRAQIGRKWQESKRLMASGRRFAADHVVDPQISRAFSNISASVEHETRRARGLLVVAEELTALERWPTTLEDMIAAERAAITQQRGDSSTAELVKIVDERYFAFLAMAT